MHDALIPKVIEREDELFHPPVNGAHRLLRQTKIEKIAH